MTDAGEMPHVIVPPEKLSEDILTALIEEFILHEGADHGGETMPLEAKVLQVRKQLQQGKVVIVYHLEEEHARIVSVHEAGAIA